MKKILLSSLLGLFGLVGAFASADSVDGFTSDSQIFKTSITEQILTVDVSKSSDFDTDNTYLCIYSTPSPYTIYYDGDDGDDNTDSEFVSSSSVYCFPKLEYFFNGGDEIGIYDMNNNSQDGYLYVSNSPITYSSGGGDINEDDSDSLLIGGVGALNPIIGSLQNTFVEFIPYIVYIGLGILGAVIGFFAIRWLVNRVRAKVYGTFSSGRRR